jgi:hypothetical protein
MIIFLVTMGQVIVLTTTFIENSQSSQGLSSQQDTTQNFALDFLNKPGTATVSIDWQNVATATLLADWRFGLSNGNGSVSPFKTGRIARNSASDYRLTYDQILAASQIDRDFAITFASTINVTILNIADAGSGNLNVLGSVTSSGSGIDNVKIWLYSYDTELQTISQVYSRTNESGFFEEVIASADSGNLANSNFHLIAAIASFGSGNQDIDYDLYFPAPATVNNQGLTLLLGSGNGYNIQILSEQVGGGPLATNVDQFAIYGGFGQNYTQGGVPTDGGTTWDQPLAVPEQGLIGFFTYDSNGGDNLAFTSFPLISNGDIQSPLLPTDSRGLTTTVFDKIILIRGVLIRFSFTTWS